VIARVAARGARRTGAVSEAWGSRCMRAY
jgi:hypothetical protein